MDSTPKWHPIMAAVEGPTGVWRMVDPSGSEYGTAEMRRVMNGTDIRYRVARHGEVIGWSTTLREACWRLHQAYLSAHSRPGRRLPTGAATGGVIVQPPPRGEDDENGNVTAARRIATIGAPERTVI